MRIEITNFCLFNGYHDVTFDPGIYLIEGDNRDDSAMGSNASGKTSLLKAIGWCYTGKVPEKNISVDNVIFTGADKCSVKVTQSDGTIVRRERSTSGSPSLYVTVVNGKERKVTQQELDEMLGINKDWFYTAFFITQDVESYFDRDPTERKKLLQGFLPPAIIERLDKLYKEVQTELKACHDDEIAIKAKVEVTSKQLKDYQQNLESLNAEIVTIEDEVKDNIKAWEADCITNIKSLEKNEQIFKKALVSKQKEFDEHSKQEKAMLQELQKLQQSVAETQSSMSKADTELGGVSAEIKSKERDIRTIETLKDGKCPTCQGPVNAKSKHSCIDEIKSALTPLYSERDKCTKNAEKLHTLHQSLTKDYTILDNKIRQVTMAMREGSVALGKLKTDVEATKTNIASVYKQRDQQIANEQQRPMQLKRQQAGMMQGIATTESAIKEFSEQLDSINEDLELWSFISVLTGSTGLKARMFDQFMTDLQSQTDAVLSALSDSLNVEFATQKEHKKGTVSESLEIQVYEDGELSKGPSNSQRQRIRIATALALAEVIISRYEDRLGFLLLDEPHKGMASVGKEKLFQLLNGMIANGSKQVILVASPQSDFCSLFDNSVKVVREGGQSSIQ